MGSLYVVTFLLALAAVGNTELLLRVHFSGRDQGNEFSKFADDKNLDIWIIDASSADVRVPDSADLLETINAKYRTEVLTNDLDSFVRNSTLENKIAEAFAKRFRSSDSINMYFHNFDQIINWMEELASNNAYVQLRDVGLTYEKRMMKVIRVAADDTKEGEKDAVLVTGGIHAGEWLAVATVNYMIDQIIKLRNSGDPRITRLLNKYDFYFMPVVNPDGYAYTFGNEWGVRLWRKTRRPLPGGKCIGVDANRNFDVEFGQGAHRNYTCGVVYPGPHPFSEFCTKNLRDFAKTFNGRLKLYYDIHARGQMHFVPFAYNKDVKPDNDAEIRRVGLLARTAIQNVNNRKFLFGPPGEILYDASGSTMDWFLLKARVKYSYGVEVYPDHSQRKGHIVPPSAIVPSGKEIFAGVLTAAENMDV